MIESPRIDGELAGDASERKEVPVFKKMFRLLALLPLHHVPCRYVTTPLLNAGQQRAELSDLTPGLIEGIRVGFNHVPELKQLVVFDLKVEAIDNLKTTILEHFGSTQETSELKLNKEQRLYIKEIAQKLQAFKEGVQIPEEAKKITQDILEQLDDKQEKVNLVAIGISAQKLIEYLVGERAKFLAVRSAYSGESTILTAALTHGPLMPCTPFASSVTGWDTTTSNILRSGMCHHPRSRTTISIRCC